MRQSLEIMNFNEQNPVRCTLQHFGVIDPHLHDFFEIDLILTGRCQVRSGEQLYSLQPEDVISFDGQTPHSFRGSDCTLLSVQFEQGIFERLLPDAWRPRFFCNSAVQGTSVAFDELRRLMARLVKNNADQQNGYALRNWSLVYELMDVLYNNFRLEETPAQPEDRYAGRVAEIAAIIGEQYADNLTLSSLARKVHLSPQYLSKFFDRHFGVTFLNYLTQVRLNHAVEKLLNSGRTIEEVSADSGFPNSHAFVQAFRKEYGENPSRYRKKAKEKAAPVLPEQPVEQHDYMAGLRKYLETPKERPGAQAVSLLAECSAAKDGGALRHTWRNVLAVTSAQAVLLGDLQDVLRRVQKEVGFRWLKFNGILSDEMRVYSESASGEPIYSFAYVDKVLDFLLSIGLKPLIQLSFMPSALAKNDKRLFGYLVSEPKSVEKWSRLVEALVRHLLDRYGPAELHGWLFSVWEQPDTPQSLYGFSKNEDFYAFYRASFQAVKACDEEIPVGSPSTFYVLQEGTRNWYLSFLDWCRENGCTPDFLNFHYYDVSLGSASGASEAFGFPVGMTLRDGPEYFGRFVRQARAEREAAGLSALPVYLTEWNTSPSQQDLLNDTCFKSCYLVKNILEHYDRLDSFAYWSLSDWMGEAPQPRELFFGGLGMFTANGIPKAVYWALTLLRRLGDTFLGRGDGWFATRQGDSIRILLYNYRHFSRLYAMGERFDMTFTDRYTPFSPEQLRDIRLRLTDLPEGEYLVTETGISRKAGSAFDQWVAMGAVELESSQELENLKSRSVPAINKYRIKAKNGALELDVLLEMLEVRLVVIEKE